MNLLPCPFCGGRAKSQAEMFGGPFEIHCESGECDARGPRERTEQAAAEKWNTRHESINREFYEEQSRQWEALLGQHPHGEGVTGGYMMRVERIKAERDAALALLNSPELLNFREGVVLEAAHQRQRWDADHDDGKTPADWFWLVGYLAGKALHAQTAGNTEKALHHTISAAAALANWHAAILGRTEMRPGISREKTAAIDPAPGTETTP